MQHSGSSARGGSHKAADVACALSVEALQGSRDSFLPAIHELRPLRGQAASAANILALLEGSAIIEAHRWCDRVQDAYSLRCAAQVHGASRDLLDYVEYTAGIELNAATDNPLVFSEEGTLLSNGNFHGQPLGFALDVLAMAVSELGSISERRTERLVNPALSEGLPAFLAADGGLNSGFMIPQYVAASLVSENKALCHPASVDSIPTSAGQEDHVSMGNASGLKAWQVLANAERVVAIELLAGAQAVELHAPLAPGVGGRAARELVRSLSPRLGDDRSLTDDIEAVAAAIRDGSALAAVEAGAGSMQMTRKQLPMPKRPFRDSAIFYGVLTVLFVVVAGVTGAAILPRIEDEAHDGIFGIRTRVVFGALPIALACFVVATAHAWWSFRRRIERERRGQ